MLSSNKLPWEEKNLPIGFDLLDGVISKEQCYFLIDWLEKAGQFGKSKIRNSNNEYSDHRTSETVFLPFMDDGLPDFVVDINMAVWNHFTYYAEKNNLSISGVEGPSIQKYSPDQYYKMHVDSSNGDRTFSAVLYLNDVERGGETSFPYQNFAVKPKAGRLVIFPSNYMWPHEALPPIGKTKYAAAYWIKA